MCYETFKKVFKHYYIMEIVFLCNSYWPNLGGAELVCKELVEILSEEHNVTVITQPAEGREDPLTHTIIETEAKTSYSYMPRLKHWLDFTQPELIISFGYGKYFSDFGAIYARQKKIPFIFMPCGDFHTDQNDWKKVLYRRLLGWIPFHVANSVVTATRWEAWHWMNKYNMYDSKKFIDIPYNLPKDFKHINFPMKKTEDYYLYIGRTGPNKKVEELIKAHAKSNSQYPLIVAGKGTDSLKHLGTSNQKFVGTVKEEEKKNLINNARAVIFPSSYESFGMVLLEADAFNTPYLMSDIPPFKELAPKNVYVFKNSVESIQEMLERVEHVKLSCPKINVPNYKKTILNMVKFYENSNVLQKRS